MHNILLYSIVLRRSQLYCIVNLLLCGYNTILDNPVLLLPEHKPKCCNYWHKVPLGFVPRHTI